MKTLIITGGLGFVGKNFYNYMKDEWEKIIIIDKNTYAADYNFVKNILNKNHEIIIGDICNQDLLKNVINDGSTIIHMAAESHVDNSFKSSLLFNQTNCFGTHTILEVCRFKKINKLIIISTDEVYGESSIAKYENSGLNPTNPYSATKASMDILSQTYMKTFKLPINIVRPNNIYGPYQNSEKIIPAIAKAIANNSKINIHGKGLTERNFLYVDDFSNAIKTILNLNITGEIFNLKSNNRYKIIDLVEKGCLIANIQTKNIINFVKDRPFNDNVYTVNDDKIRSYGWKEKEDFVKKFQDIIINKLFL